MGLYDYMWLVPREELTNLKMAAAASKKSGLGESPQQQQENNLSVVIQGDCDGGAPGGGSGGGGRAPAGGVRGGARGGRGGRPRGRGGAGGANVPGPPHLGSNYPSPLPPSGLDSTQNDSSLSSRSTKSNSTMDWSGVSGKSDSSSSGGWHTADMDSIDSYPNSTLSSSNSTGRFSPDSMSTRIDDGPLPPATIRKYQSSKRKRDADDEGGPGSPFMKKFKIDDGPIEVVGSRGKKRGAHNLSSLSLPPPRAKEAKMVGTKRRLNRSSAAGDDLKSLIHQRVRELQGVKKTRLSTPSSSIVVPAGKSDFTKKERELVHQIRDSQKERGGTKRTREEAKFWTGGRVGKHGRESGEGEKKKHAFSTDPRFSGKKRLYEPSVEEDEREREDFPEKRIIMSKVIEDDDWPM